MLSEVLLNAIAPFKGLKGVKLSIYDKNYDYTIQYEINDLLLVVTFIRFYMLLKFGVFMTQFASPRAVRVCGMNGADADPMFAIKGLMKQKPW